jgi:hypothetical protein
LEKNAFETINKTHSYQQLKSIEDVCSNLFSDDKLDAIAKKHGFIKRSRKISASAFVKSLIFSEENHDRLSLLDLKFDLINQAKINVSKVAVHNRFNPEAVSFLKEIFSVLLSSHVALDRLQNLSDYPFSGIYIKDSTKFKLPSGFAKSYPSYGSFGKNTSLMNIQYEFELLSGNCERLELTKATRNDQRDSKETTTDIKKGGLYLRDLGYVTMTYLKAIENKDAYYLNRLPHTGIYQKKEGKFEKIDWNKIDKAFNTSDLEYCDMEVYIGKKDKLKTRLLIAPVPDKVAGKRIRKAEQGGKRSDGYLVSKEYRIKAHYNLYITNVSSHILPAMKVIETYRLRWQVELIFKTWKSNLDIHKYKSMKIERMECQLIAKLIWILLNTKLFQITNMMIRKENRDRGCSVLKFFKWVKTLSQELRQVVGQDNLLAHWFYSSVIPIMSNLNVEKRLKKLTHCEILSPFMSY